MKRSCLYFIIILIAGLNQSVQAEDSSSCWIADKHLREVIQLSYDGIEIQRIKNFNFPISIGVNPNNETCWIADLGDHDIKKITSDGQLFTIAQNIYYPMSVSVNPADGTCWVANMGNNQIIKLDSDGKELLRINGFNHPTYVNVNPADGTCWVADWDNHQVVKLSEDGNTLLTVNEYKSPICLSVNPTDGSCWVADQLNNQVSKISSNGKKEFILSTFNYPNSVSADLTDGSCWVADMKNDRVVKLSHDGKKLFEVKGFNSPASVSVNPFDGSCWVADRNNAQIVKLSKQGEKILTDSNYKYPVFITVIPGQWPVNQLIKGNLTINPETINLKSKGKWITAYIELPDKYHPDEIDIKSIYIVEIGEYKITPIYAELHPTAIGDNDMNGVSDLMVKFNRQAIYEHIYDNTTSLTITIEFELYDKQKCYASNNETKTIHVAESKTTEKPEKEKTTQKEQKQQNELEPIQMKNDTCKIFNNRIRNNKNGYTKIQYNLETPSRVTITVYNIVKEKIKIIVNEYKNAGNFNAIWSGVNEQQNTVACGLYFINIKTDKMNETRKVIVTK